MNLTESWQRLSECMVPEANLAVQASGRPVGNWHALFSDQPRPLLLPAHHRRARRNGVRFFLPQFWRRSYARLRLQAHDLLGERAHLPLLKLPPSTSPTLSDRLAVTEAPQLAFLIGTPGPYQKASMLLMSSQGEPLSLVKIALGREANEMVRTETEWLKRLCTCHSLSECVPTLLRSGTTRNGYSFLAQSIVSGNPDSGAFTGAHAEFLRRLGELDCHIGRFEGSPIHANLSDRFTRLLPHLTAAQSRLLQGALSDCTRRLSDWVGPFVISHGDFAFWNIRTHTTHICVFDWEYAHAGSPPLFDLLHFHLIAPASSGRVLGTRDMRRALAAARAFALLTYPEFQWEEGVVASLGLAYLLHTLLFYGESRHELIESHPVIRSYCKLVEERTTWLP